MEGSDCILSKIVRSINEKPLSPCGLPDLTHFIFTMETMVISTYYDEPIELATDIWIFLRPRKGLRGYAIRRVNAVRWCAGAFGYGVRATSVMEENSLRKLIRKRP